MITRGDISLIIFILIFSISIFFGFHLYGLAPGKTYAVIEADGLIVQKISLGNPGPDFETQVEGHIGSTRIQLLENKIRILESPCPDKDCVRQGWISRPGQILVCLPNRVLVKITSDDMEDDLDGISF